MKFFIVTGMSGSGKSLAVKQLEDLRFFCVDNIPPVFMANFAKLIMDKAQQQASELEIQKVAVVADIRGGKFFEDLEKSLMELKSIGIKYEILFLDASDEVLVRRYKASRRKHPLAENDRVLNGIHLEREKLSKIKSVADYVLDTSNLSTTELKAQVESLFSDHTNTKDLVLNVVSFGFKYGIPLDADFMFDVRFLPNPYYVEELRAHNGNEIVIQDYVMKSEVSQNFLKKILEMILFVLPEVVLEGKKQLVIAIGCTGGKHRSVTIANKLAEALSKDYNRVVVQHRDVLED